MCFPKSPRDSFTLIVHTQPRDNQTTNPKKIVTSIISFDCSVVLVLVFVLFVVLVVGFWASACFFASQARRLRSASLLPEATQPGFFAVAGFVFGTSEVTQSGVGGVTAGDVFSSGIASSVGVVIVYI